jgi:hypothetical protein
MLSPQFKFSLSAAALGYLWEEGRVVSQRQIVTYMTHTPGLSVF